MGLVIAGIVLLGVGVGLFFGRKGALDKVNQLKGSTRRKISELLEMAGQIGKDVGSGHYGEVVEVQGKIVSSNPLTAELSNQKCVYYRAEVTEEYEEDHIVTDKNTGKQKTERKRQTRVVSSNKRSLPFHVEDESGKVEVLPDGAEIDEEKSLSKFEQAGAMTQGNTLSFGGFSINLSNVNPARGRRTLGYQLNEWILPVDRSCFVIGEATDAEGRLILRKPSEKHHRFIISTRSKETLIQDTEKKAMFFLIGSIASAVIGVSLSIFGGFAQ